MSKGKQERLQEWRGRLHWLPGWGCLPGWASLRRHGARWTRRALVVCVVLIAAAWLLARAVPLPTRLAQAPSTVVAFADDSPAFVFLSPDDKYRMAVIAGKSGGEIEELIDPDYLRALLCFEDKRFYFHPGVDPLAIARSAVVNLAAGRVVTGASTLTMQLVRLAEPRPRNLRSKAIEALRALQVELVMSKQEVLAAYLTLLPFGRNIEGVRAASWAYFGHSARELSADEIAVLLAVPQRPTVRFPSADNHRRLQTARDEIAEWLIDRGGLSTADVGTSAGADLLARIRQQPAPRAIRPLPRHAPHAAFWLSTQQPQSQQSQSLHIATTLDRGLQQLAENELAVAHAGLANRGIHNGAAVLVDHRTFEVRALVGNFDFWDEQHGGQIAGFATRRSPGSALKPFIYALAIDRGLALPEHLVTDTPATYADYAPHNYDGRFTGLIALEDALSHSLNIPFVRLLSRLGVERFIGTLRAAGAEGLSQQPGYYGLSSAIGAVEVTPLELAGLYAGLAQDGTYRPLRWLKAQQEGASEAAFETSGKSASESAGVQLLTAGSSHLTRRALARRDRPDFPHRRRLSGAPSAIHWKTGTSYGHRDAWAAGSGPEYTAVVWLGNFDNQPAIDLVGADAAGPLLFDLLEAVSDRSRPAVFDHAPSDLKRVEVCAYSGYLPTDACEQRKWAKALRRQVPTERCRFHVGIDIDLATGQALNPTCRAGRRWQRRNFLVWPASVRRFLNQGQSWLPSPPQLAAGCQDTQPRQAPSILSPPPGQVLVLLPGVPASDQEVPLQADTRGAATDLSWFVDGTFLGKAPANERLWWLPTPGRHEITVVDDLGQLGKRQLEVRARRGTS